MNPHLIVKPIGDLRVDDLQQHWLWGFANDVEGLEGQDETSVEPIEADTISPEIPEAFAVADFLGPGDRPFIGLVCIITRPGVKISPGAIVTDRAYGPLPDPRHWLAESMLSFSEKQLDMKRTEFSPLRYRLRMKFTGELEPRSGEFSY